MNTVPYNDTPTPRPPPPVLQPADVWMRWGSPMLPADVRAIQANALQFAADISLEYVIDGLKNQHPAQAILDRLVAKLAELKNTK